MDRMKTIGLVGGVASGKSLVARLFGELGAGLLDADRAGHNVLSQDPEVRSAVLHRWGEKVLASDGSISRAAIAACVFASDASDDAAQSDREFLEALLHPRIRAKLDVEKRAFAAAGRPAVVLDAPLLLEAGWGPLCDLVVMVDVPRDARLARAMERGWSEAEFTRREAAQWPVDTKSQHADAVLSNAGSIDDLRREVRHLWDAHIAPASA
jgi:dephospho-CoA kinase